MKNSDIFISKIREEAKKLGLLKIGFSRPEELKKEVADIILHDNIFGVDVSAEAVEITQLALWIRTAQKGRTLADLSRNIICGNSLVADAEVHPRAMEWEKVFPEIFSGETGGFDCVIGNPPWERLNLKNREFFAHSAPHIIKAVNAAESRKLIAKLENDNPELYDLYIKAKDSAENTISYVRVSGRYPLTAKGDINTYACFAELAHNIVGRDGRVGLLTPTGIATDHTNRKFFEELIDSKSLIGLYDFENRKKIFPDVDGRYKFCVLLFGGSGVKKKSMDFVFFAHRMEELKEKKRHIRLSADDFKRLNPNTRTCPIFRSRRDAELTKSIYKNIPVLIDESRKKGGNPWDISYMIMFHQSFDANLFISSEQLKADKYKFDGTKWQKGKKIFLPLYEAKMIQAYDHRAASVVVDDTKWTRQGQTSATTLVNHQNPEFSAQPRWWIDEIEVKRVLAGHDTTKMLAFKNVTSPTNERTMIISFIPYCGVIHSAPLILTGPKICARLTSCLLGNLNSFIYDFVCRQKIGGINLSYYIINQIPTFPPDFYGERCPWDRRKTLDSWVSERVLKLTCVSEDMRGLAASAGFAEELYRWQEGERAA